jgi:hypothetical protein
MPVVVVPVVFLAPLTPLSIPPPVVVVPAVFTSFPKFMTCVLGLAAVPAVVLNRFVETMIGPFCPVLAFRLVGTDTLRAGEDEKSDQRR